MLFRFLLAIALFGTLTSTAYLILVIAGVVRFVAKRRQLSSEGATCIDINRAIQPLRLRNRRVTLNDHRGAAIVRCPVVADRKAELIDFAGCLAE